MQPAFHDRDNRDYEPVCLFVSHLKGMWRCFG